MLKLRKYRILELLDQREIAGLKGLAEHLDLHPSNVSHLVNNKSNFTKKQLERLLSVLECDLNEILEFVNEVDENKNSD
tara:strand:+ start:6606 stop:6842 length:237 start_codon:yes stop_codon:yes gene_type:complete